MDLYQKFRKLPIDHAAIGMEQRDCRTKYYCTPKGAKAIGHAGIDGIHFCCVKGFGETVFAVNPSNYAGNQVHPIARSFKDLLSLLLACGSMDAIEQVYLWNETQFYEYVKENQLGEAQTAVLEAIREQLHVTPMAHPYAYLKELQDSFDYSALRFPVEYYEALDPPAKQPPEWKVTYNGGFWAGRGRAGKEVTVEKQFLWGDEEWHIPAIYLCSGGLVIDFCVAISRERFREFFGKWGHRIGEMAHELPESMWRRMNSENPFNIEFDAKVTMNERKLPQSQASITRWIPASDVSGDFAGEAEDPEAKFVLEHYGYDLTRSWVIYRISFPWADKRPRSISALHLALLRRKAELYSAPFKAPDAGESVEILNPKTGQMYTLTVRERESQELDPCHFPNDSAEYPRRCVTLLYTLSPEPRGFSLLDCDDGDPLRGKNSDGPIAAAVGVIGIEPPRDKQAVYLHPDGTQAKRRTFCSSLHYAPVSELNLQAVFYEKQLPDIEVQII